MVGVFTGALIGRNDETGGRPGDGGQGVRRNPGELIRGKFQGIDAQAYTRRLIIAGEKIYILVPEKSLHAGQEGIREHEKL
jgi:hypothetical protein